MCSKDSIVQTDKQYRPSENFYCGSCYVYECRKSLRKEFPISVSNKFEFVTLAIDTEKDQNQNIIPGVGGMVYPKLGLGDSHDKNKYMPELVKSRIL